MLNSSNLAVALEVIAQIDRELAIAVAKVDTLAAHGYAAHRALGELRGSLERSRTGTRELREELLAFGGDARHGLLATKEET